MTNMIPECSQCGNATATMSQACTFDNPRVVLQHIRAHRLTVNDSGYHGELVRLADNPGVRMNYFSANGITVDALAESLWSAGFTSRRLDCSETLELLDQLFTRQPKSPARAKVPANALQRAKSNRNRLYQCNGCGQRFRGTRASDAICGRCFDAWLATLPEEIQETVGSAIAPFRFERKDLLPEEIEQELAATSAA